MNTERAHFFTMGTDGNGCLRVTVSSQRWTPYIHNKTAMFVYHVWLQLGVTFCVAKQSIVQKSFQSLR